MKSEFAIPAKPYLSQKIVIKSAHEKLARMIFIPFEFDAQILLPDHELSNVTTKEDQAARGSL